MTSRKKQNKQQKGMLESKEFLDKLYIAKEI